MERGRYPPVAKHPPGRAFGMKEYTRQRLRKAARMIDAARILLVDGYADSAADRAYYAMFYVAEALLAERDLDFSSHGAVHGAFGRAFAKTRALDPKYHGWLLRAFETRQRATYGADTDDDLVAAGAGEMIDRAEEFLSVSRAHLEGQT